MTISYEKLIEILRYEPETGRFFWLMRPANTQPEKTWNTRYVGKEAGCLNPLGYVRISISKTFYLAHRLAWLYVHGEWPTLGLDHKDGNPTNNRISNLRQATQAQNVANKRRNRNNLSGLKGAGVYDGRYRARIFKDGKDIALGYFATPEKAAAAYAGAAVRLHGEFARYDSEPAA